MIHVVKAFAILLLSYLLYGVYYSYFDLKIVPDEILRAEPEGFYDYRGAINIHTRASTGSGTISEIAQAANKAGLDFIFIHDAIYDLERPHSLAGYHDDVLVFVESEFPFLGARLLNLGASVERNLSGPGHVQFYLSERLQEVSSLQSGEGFFVWAHPNPRENPWSEGLPKGISGVEIINLKSLWQERWLYSPAMFWWSILLFPFNEQLALTRLLKEPRGTIGLWDRLQSDNRLIAGFASADANSKFIVNDQLFFAYPSYETLLSMTSLHILLRSQLTGDEARDRTKTLQALHTGQFYSSLDMLGNPKGFNFLYRSPQGDEAVMGESLPLANLDHELGRFHVSLGSAPSVPYSIVLIRDGQMIAKSDRHPVEWSASEPGVYRVEVRVLAPFPFPEGSKWLPWIYSNPIRLKPRRESR